MICASFALAGHCDRLDSSFRAVSPGCFFIQFPELGWAPEADFVYRVLQNRASDVAGGKTWFWDPLAAGLLADESLGDFREGRVKVYPASGPGSGLTRLNESGVPMRYAVSADRKRFEMEFLRTLNQP